MKKKIKGHFLPFGYTQTLFQRLHTLRQGTRSVDDYTEEFYHLFALNDLSKIEEQLMARYLGGLWQSLQDILSLHSIWMVFEAYQHALTVEEQKLGIIPDLHRVEIKIHEEPVLRSLVLTLNLRKVRVPIPTSIVSDVGS